MKKVVSMRRLILTALVSLFALNAAQSTAAAASATQTVIFVRHGEKPEAGLGQLSCRGLNRSLKLPAVIAKQFGKPAAIFAPNPSEEKDDKGETYAYVRPLATVEPTAISLGLPVDTRFGFEDIDKLEEALDAPAYRNATVLVGWEHKQIVKLVRDIVKENGGDKHSVPKWSGDDFDSIYVLRMTRDGEKTDVQFERRNQGLNNLPETCPL